MKIPQTIEMQVGALNASEHNPRQITEDDFAELVKSLLLLPKGLYYRPVVVDDRNIALAGNMRLRALKYIHELGFDDLAEILRASYRFRHFDEAKQSALLNYWREWQMHPTVPTLYASELDEDEQQRRYDGIILGRGHVCKEFLHGHVLSVMRGCFGNGNRPSAAASSHQMAVRRAEDTARIGKKSNDQWHHTQAITNRRKTAGMPVCRSCRICASNGGCRFVR